jgi:hypothetical protein
MGACAFLMPTASAQFIRKQRYDLRASLGLTIGGIPACWSRSTSCSRCRVRAVRWLVVVVVIYASITLLSRVSATAAGCGSRSASRDPSRSGL